MSEDIRYRVHRRVKEKRVHKLRLVIILALLIFVPTGIWKLLHRPDFAFGDIRISGSSQLNTEDVLLLANSQLPINLFNIDRDRVEEGLSHDVRFLQATTEYVWPLVLEIKLVERKPALYMQNAHKNFVLIDYSGLVMNTSVGIPNDKAPVLVGLTCGDMYIGDQVDLPQVKNLLEFMGHVESSAVDKIAEINMESEQQTKLLMRDGLVIYLGALHELPDKAEKFSSVYHDIMDKELGIEYIDFTFEKPYVKLKKGVAPKIMQGVNK